MTNTMAFAISTPTSSLLYSSCSSHNVKKPSPFLFSNSTTVSVHKNPIFQHLRGFSQLGFTPFSQWSGLKQLGVSISQYSVKKGMKGKCRGKGVFASLFGIGAPEALVIGVVALLIFGPKGLAEVARNLGKTLRSFQPTIRELQEVSREFKSSLEREIGLDEIDNRAPNSFISNNPMPTTLEDFGANVEPNKSSDDDSSPSSGGVYTAEEYLKVTETQLKGALARLQNENEEKEKDKNQSESQAPSQNTPQEEAASLVPPIPSPEPANEI